MRKIMILVLTLALCLSAGACSASLNYPSGTPSGLKQGVWDGAISFVTIPASVLFPRDIHVYHPDNNGLAYNAGFFVPAVLEAELSIPLFLCAWVLHWLYQFFAEHLLSTAHGS